MGECHTSQFSRIKQRPPATDLSGPKASADSLTPRRSNLAVEDAVDFYWSNLSYLPYSVRSRWGGILLEHDREQQTDLWSLKKSSERKVEMRRCGLHTLGFLTG